MKAADEAEEAKAAAASAAAEAYGDIVLQADGYAGAKASFLGVFELQQHAYKMGPFSLSPFPFLHLEIHFSQRLR